ncbi:flavin-containing monooxygenase [Mycobacterium hubeiense]|uniref:flavin-containing monooxygenase n=1 Tax=Mycobacterium hubeiense TaxID=1867256 RepID=UPI001E4DAF80|nr:NAD(P)/FAD-dependent oxidoreductase [Mycobacterium sp. QGD 101]
MRSVVGEDENRRTPHDVVVIGAGFSGIGAGIRLRNAGIDDFVIIDSAGDLGGTWRDNRYPGVAVDVTSLNYCFSWEQNPRWSRLFAPGEELLAYAHRCADKYRLRPHMRFDHHVERMRFDGQSHEWTIDLTGRPPLRARFVILATGGLVQPKSPDIAGIDTFMGKVMHTARWDHDHDLAGQRVAVIGTGASAVQVVPSIADEVEHLSVFQRTPIWIVPKPDARIPASVQRAFESMPIAQKTLRAITAVLTQAVFLGSILYYRQLPGLARAFERICRAHLARQVADPTLRDALTPTYSFGCKRPSFSNDYWRAFNRSNVDLVTAPIETITPTGIRTVDGTERDIDLLVLATGFKVFELGNLPPFDVYGPDGTELGLFWDEHRYQAYEGTSVPQFPNLFHVIGPYAMTGSSYFSMIEAMTLHAARCITEARRRGATYVAVRQEPHDAYFAEVQRRLRNSVFVNGDCTRSNSYYFDRHGDTPLLRPSTGWGLWWRHRRFDLDNYEYRTAEPVSASATGSAHATARSPHGDDVHA